MMNILHYFQIFLFRVSSGQSEGRFTQSESSASALGLFQCSLSYRPPAPPCHSPPTSGTRSCPTPYTILRPIGVQNPGSPSITPGPRASLCSFSLWPRPSPWEPARPKWRWMPWPASTRRRWTRGSRSQSSLEQPQRGACYICGHLIIKSILSNIRMYYHHFYLGCFRYCICNI